MRRSRWSGPLRLVLSLAVMFAAVALVFPLLFGPRIDVPTDLEFGNPSSVMVQISNPNLTPILDLDYRCELERMTLADGKPVANEKVLVQGAARKIEGRSAVAGRCQAAYLVTAPLQAVEYKLTLSYHNYPWKQKRTNVYTISAKLNNKGNITGWKLD